MAVLIAGIVWPASQAEPAPAADEITPVARFAFESADEFKADGRKIDGNVVFGRAGPRPPRERGFTADNKAALFGGGRGFIRIADPGADSPFDFTAGDSITLEAWVNPFELQDGQQVYVVGKGSTGSRRPRPLPGRRNLRPHDHHRRPHERPLDPPFDPK